MSKSTLEEEFALVVQNMSKKFANELDLHSLLFLIGVQELGKGAQKFSKSEKVDLMHIAICTLLSQYDYYIYEGIDDDGWPHWIPNKKLPLLNAEAQQELIKQAIVDYFKK